MIATGVGLSVRRVYELFEPGSMSLMRWVWSERLERCRRDLSAPSLRGRPVGAIAYSWGFSDLCHFSRTFKQRFGVSPRQWRKGRRTCRWPWPKRCRSGFSPTIGAGRRSG
jgi:AraC-like DNA-binding protein